MDCSMQTWRHKPHEQVKLAAAASPVVPLATSSPWLRPVTNRIQFYIYIYIRRIPGRPGTLRRWEVESSLSRQYVLSTPIQMHLHPSLFSQLAMSFQMPVISPDEDMFQPAQWPGACAHHVVVSNFQWKPFWLATQRDPQNDWTATQNRVNYDVLAQAPFNEEAPPFPTLIPSFSTSSPDWALAADHELETSL